MRNSAIQCLMYLVTPEMLQNILKLEKKYAPALDNYGQSCFVRSDFLKMKCFCKTQMMPPPDHKKLYTSKSPLCV